MTNRTRELIHPSEALKLIAQTLNCPSIAHERVNMAEVLNATAAVLASNPPAKVLTITRRGVVVEGLNEILAAVHAWKPVPFDVLRDAPGKRAYRRGPAKAPRTAEIGKIEHSISILDDVIKSRGVAAGR